MSDEPQKLSEGPTKPASFYRHPGSQIEVWYNSMSIYEGELEVFIIEQFYPATWEYPEEHICEEIRYLLNGVETKEVEGLSAAELDNFVRNAKPCTEPNLRRLDSILS